MQDAMMNVFTIKLLSRFDLERGDETKDAHDQEAPRESMFPNRERSSLKKSKEHEGTPQSKAPQQNQRPFEQHC